jgi:predicted MFS family arabinose efflux permease
MIYFIIATLGGIAGSMLTNKFGPKVIGIFGAAGIILALVYFRLR